MAAYNFYDIIYKSWDAANSAAAASPTATFPEVDPSFDTVFHDVLTTVRAEMAAQSALGISSEAADICEQALPFSDIDCSEVAIAGAVGSGPSNLKASLTRYARILFVQGAAIMVSEAVRACGTNKV